MADQEKDLDPLGAVDFVKLDLEFNERPMIFFREFAYKPAHHESEKASYSYVMSLIALAGGMPLPILNFLATLIFYLGKRKSTYFVRWHCTQALFSQLTLFVLNSIGFYWVLSIVYWGNTLSNTLIAYLILVVIANVTEFIATIITSVNANQGKHVEWWLYGPLTNQICKP